MPPGTRGRSSLDVLTAAEAQSVLSELLTGHPELWDEAEGLASASLARVDPDAVADDVVRTFQQLHFTAIGDRAGRQRGGYVHETDAGWQLLHEALQPWCDHVRRLAAGGFDGAAQQLALGVVAGLYRLQTDAHPESLLGWMDARENAPELADEVLEVLDVAGVAPSDDALAEAAPDWYG